LPEAHAKCAGVGKWTRPTGISNDSILGAGPMQRFRWFASWFFGAFCG